MATTRFIAEFVPYRLDQAVDTGDFTDDDTRLHGIARGFADDASGRMQPDNRELGRGVRHRTSGQTQAWSDKPTLHDARIVDDLKRGCRPEVDDDEREPVELFCGNAIRHTIGAPKSAGLFRCSFKPDFKPGPTTNGRMPQRTCKASTAVGKPGDNGGRWRRTPRIATPDPQKRRHAQKRLISGQAIRSGHAPCGQKVPFVG